MRTTRCIIVLVLFASVASGCGPKLLKAKGRVLKDGVAFTPPAEDRLIITFMPVADKVREMYVAAFNNADGTFNVLGRTTKGLPPGKYRVLFQYKPAEGNESPLSDDITDEDGSPYVFDVDSSTKEIVIDFDRVPSAS